MVDQYAAVRQILYIFCAYRLLDVEYDVQLDVMQSIVT